MELPSPTQPAEPAEGSRRRSGRVTRAPEKLSPSIGKRKRASGVATAGRDAPDEDDGDADDDEDDGDDDDENDDDDDSDSVPDEEELRDRARRKRQNLQKSKASAKRAKTNGTTSTLAIRSTPKKPRAKARKPRESAISQGGLYGDVFGSTDDAETIAGQWLARFNQDEAKGMQEIINLVLRASGCELEVTKEDIEDPDNCTNRLTDLQDEFQAQHIVDYPLIAKGRAANTFRAGLAAFFIALIKTIAADKVLLGSPELIENIQVWVSAMSSAASRPFRHTATVVSLDIVSALAQVAKSNIERRARMLRQIEGEQRKARGGNKERVKALQSEADEAAETQTALDNLLRDWFETVFVHRYRDIDPKIRVDCLSALAEWMDTYPDYFLDGGHLRYLGWCLSDTAAPTRLNVLRGLAIIFRDDNKLGGLRQFTERFRARMVEMAVGDADVAVRTCAVQLLDILRDKGLLEPDDIDTVGKLLYDSEAKVRKAVVSFFATSVEESFDVKLDDLGGQDVVDEALAHDNDDDYGTPRVDWLRFKALAELMAAYDAEDVDAAAIAPAQPIFRVASAGLDSRYTIAAHAILPEIPVLEDWEALAGMLLFDNSSSPTSNDVASQIRRDSKLSEHEETILLDVLNALLKHTLTDSAEDSAGPRVARKTKAEIREHKQMQDAAGQRLAQLMPQLLSKFGAAPDAAAAVLRLGRLLNLQVFQQLRQDSTAFSSLLDNIRKQFSEHEDQAVIAEASAALAHAKSFDELEEITSGKLAALWDDTCRMLVSLCSGQQVGVRGSQNLSTTSSLSNTLLRISNLASVSDCTEAFETRHTVMQKNARKGGASASAKAQQQAPTTPIAVLQDILLRGIPVSNTAANIDALEDSIVCDAIKSIFFYFLWHARALGESDSALVDQTVSEVSKHRDTTLKHLRRVMRHRRVPDDVRLASAGLLLDLHTAFMRVAASVPGEVDVGPLADLGTKIDGAVQTEVVRVFTAAERDFTRRTGRQIPEPEEDDEPIDDDADPEDSEDEPEDGGEGDEASDEARRRKQQSMLLAEQRFCTLASKIVLALVAGCTDEPLFASGARKSSLLRKRLLRNKTKLGHNFKEICERLEDTGEKRKSRAAQRATAKAGVPALSRETVEHDDDDDEAREDEAELEERRQAEHEGERRRDEERQAEAADTNEAEAESVVGD